MRKLCMGLALLAACAVANAAPSLRYSAVGTYAANASSLAASLSGGQDPQSGDTVCLALQYQDSGFSTKGFSGVSDGTNSFTREVQSANNSGSGNSEIWCKINIGTASGTYTVTGTAATASSLTGTVVILDVEGVAASPIDKSGATTSASANSVTVTASGANTQATDFEISSIGVPYDPGGATNVPSGWTSIENDYSGTGFLALTVVYRVATMTETASAAYTWTTAGFYGGTILTLLPATGGSCTHDGILSGGTIGVPNGSSGNYRSCAGTFVTPDCSSITYKQTQGACGTS